MSQNLFLGDTFGAKVALRFDELRMVLRLIFLKFSPRLLAFLAAIEQERRSEQPIQFAIKKKILRWSLTPEFSRGKTHC